MAKSKVKKVTIFNIGKRTYADVHNSANLEPQGSLEVPANVAAFFLKSYPKDIVSGAPGQSGNSAENKAREASLEKREIAVAKREQEIGQAGEELESQRKVVSERAAELDEREKAVTEAEEELLTNPDAKLNGPANEDRTEKDPE